MTWTVEISVGPIQQFVGQSRRTRDLWGSSYLLSFLCAHAAVAAAGEDGVTVLQPNPGNPFCRLVGQTRTGAAVTEEAPVFASVPNHLIFQVVGDPERVADAATGGLQQAWRRVTDEVWDRFVDQHAHLGRNPREIWDRQVVGFWEIMWVAAPGDEASGLLAHRKLIRDHRLPEEPGDKCMVMSDFQELSGHSRLTGRGREAQQRFWDEIRNQVGDLNLRSNERLSAIALIKRLYPLVAEQALGWKVDMTRWPSTVDLAAMPWLRQVGEVAVREATEYADLVKRTAPPYREYPDTAPVRRQGPYENLVPEEARPFAKLNPNYLYRNFIKDPRHCPLHNDDPGTRQGLLGRLEQLQRHQLPEAAEKLRQHEPRRDAVGAPPVFYALVLADGDRLGEVLGRLSRERVGQALDTFTVQVSKVVKEHHGFVVYAGGDDVLAMLPVPEALGCAEQLATAYQEAFRKVGELEDTPTLSVAVLFAHMTLALTTALREAHHLLDQVAKDGNGRASLAVEVLKRGGPSACWVSHWERIGDRSGQGAVTALSGLEQELGGELSSTLLYRMRRVLTTVTDWSDWRPGAVIGTPTGIDLPTLLRAEIRSSLDHRTPRERSDQESDQATSDYAARLAEQVTALLHPAYGPDHSSTVQAGQLDRTRIALDALPLARFLATGGQEEEHEW